jgi:glycosyltransferase involved in cell wall biosynthesis
MMHKPRIAYLTLNDARDRRSWSGAHYCIAQALEKHCGPVTLLGPLWPAGTRYKKAASLGWLKLTGRKHLYTHTLSLARQVARMAEKKLAAGEFDLVFSPTSSVAIAELQTPLPIVYLSDTTFRLVANYYPEFSGLLKRSFRQADQIEHNAIQRSEMLLYPSSWAARSARDDYGAPAGKIHVLPLGANLENPPAREMAVAHSMSPDKCRLLFIGVEWERKGGDIAFETLEALLKRNIPAELTIVGCQPPPGVGHERMTVIPFLNKNKPEERKRFSQLLLESDFFLLPTRAECFGIAFCEANAFGLPVLATDTGGVSEIVRNGVNGYLLPLSARGEAYAEKIAGFYHAPARYAEMRAASRDRFDECLNWDAWGRAVNPLLQEMLLHRASASESQAEAAPLVGAR